MLEGDDHQPDENLAEAHNADRQGAEHQRRDDHFDQPQKQIGEQRNIVRPGGDGGWRRVGMDSRAGEDPHQHKNDDEEREFVCVCHSNDP
ncbi:Uncharacterised protein [Klebsiella pneumoniae]|nr:Uncharacterised protein [Klebsiella pneumoniae]